MSRQKLIGWALIIVSSAYMLYFLKVTAGARTGSAKEGMGAIRRLTADTHAGHDECAHGRNAPAPARWSAPWRDMTSTRIDRRFTALKSERRAALVTFITAGDPDPETSLAILQALPGAGADMIELGMPFTDPMADGPAIQLSSQRALKSGQTLHKTLDMVRAFRRTAGDVPIVLMGYYNPIYVYGVGPFLRDAKDVGVDGLIVVDLPPEQDDELCLPAIEGGT